MSREILPWRKIESHKIADCKVFSLERNRALMPTGEANRAFDFYVLHPSHWCNVIPITDDGRVVFIEQYRHGIEKVTLEIPGGAVDPEDASSQYAAGRELFEETGFVANELTFIGRNHPNPALQSNFCDTFLARGAKQICEPTFQGAEDIKIKLVELDEVPHLIASGAITHALVLVAFYFLQLHELKTGTPKPE
ncbi:MAG: NUDIX hydrolase [Candidatus Melainabacteria bacterium]|nr:NUDIX hydrolase [Candidatus Melainabacteria bacterium]